MLSRGIPQDVIDLIVGELRNDTASLLQCATVSRSYFFPSRRYLLFKIKIDNPKRCQGLLGFLSQHPGLSSYIQELYVNGTGWVIAEDTFSPLLRILTNAGTLRHFSFFVLPRDETTTWITLSPEARNAIRRILSVPLLRCIEIQGPIACTFQLEMFNILPPTLRQLSFVGDHTDACKHEEREDCPQPAPSPPFAEKYLNSLQLSGNMAMSLLTYLEHPYCPIRLTRLRELSVSGEAPDARHAAIAVAKMAAHTLEYLSWDGPPMTFWFPPPDLSVLRHLRFLNFVTRDSYIYSLRNVFKHCPLPEGLEEINIVLVTYPSAFSRPLKGLDEVFRARSTKTHLVDKIIAAICNDHEYYPRLRHVKIQVLIEDYDNLAKSRRRSGLSPWFPRSHASSRFIGCFGDIEKMEQIMREL